MTLTNLRERPVPAGSFWRTSAPGSKGPFYGWVVVGAAFVAMTLTSGLGFYNLSVYLRALTAQGGLGVAAVSAPTGLFFLSSGLAGLAVARLLDRYRARMVMAVAAVGASVALGSLGLVDSVAGVYVAYVALGAFMGGISLIPGTTILTRWFVEKRASALALATAGLSFGGIVVTPLSARLIDVHGLGVVAPWLGGVLFAVLMPVTLLLFRESPQSVGMAPDGARSAAGPPVRSRPDPSISKEVRSPFFLLFAGAYLLIQMASVGVIAHQYNFVSIAINEVFAASMVSLLAMSSLLARLVGGVIATRMSLRSFLWLLIATQAAGILVLGTVKLPAGFTVGSALFGASLGNLLMMETLVIAEAFGVDKYAKLFSIQQMIVRLGVAVGPLLIGAIFEFGGESVSSYGVAFVIAAIISGVGAAVLFLAGPLPSPDKADAGPPPDQDDSRPHPPNGSRSERS